MRRRQVQVKLAAPDAAQLGVGGDLAAGADRAAVRAGRIEAQFTAL
ncbi:MAG: hypothetical protein ACXVGC_14410 [Mycobacteriaceae bacterium]